MLEAILATTNPPLANPNTLGLFHFNESEGSTTFINSGRSNYTVNGTGVAASREQAKFGAGSAKFIGEADSKIILSMAAEDILQTSDFTLEAFVFRSTVTANENKAIISSGSNNVSNPNGGFVMLLQSTGKLNFVESSGSSLIWNFNGTAGTTQTIIANAWNHLMVQRKNGVMYGAINGAMTTGNANTVNYARPALGIGDYGDAGGTRRPFVGYMDEVRIARTAVYPTGSTITVPTAPLTLV